MADRFDDERDRSREDMTRESGPQPEDERSYRRKFQERGVADRAGDEVRSWFGNEEAERRRERDKARHEAELRYQERGYDRGEHDYRRDPGTGSGYDRGYGSPDPRREPSGRWDTGYGKDGRNYTDRTHGSDYPDGGFFDRAHEPEPEYGRAEGQHGMRNPDRHRSASTYSGRPYYGGSWRGDYRGSRGYESDRFAWQTGSGASPNRREWSSRDDEYRRGSAPGLWTGDTGPHTGRGPRGYQRSDERIREDICDRLTRHGHIDATDVDIAVSTGEVTLSGTVDTRDAKRLAEDVAESVDGVRDVTNQIKVYRGDYGREPRGGAEEGGLGERGAPHVLGLSGSKEGTGTTLQSPPQANQAGSGQSTEPGRNKR